MMNNGIAIILAKNIFPLKSPCSSFDKQVAINILPEIMQKAVSFSGAEACI